MSVSQSTRRIDLPRLPPGLPKVLVLQRLAPMATAEWQGLMSAFLAQGWIVVTELDDHPALIADVHGQAFDHQSWNTVRLVHAVQTSTAPLCEAIRPHNPETVVFENAAFSHVADAVAPAQDGRLRVFYGAFNRGALSTRLAASLAPVAAARPGIEFVVVHDRAFFDALGHVHKDFSPALPYARYLDLMGSCAVALMPLEEGAAQACKSDIKFVEASSRGLALDRKPDRLCPHRPRPRDRPDRRGQRGLGPCPGLPARRPAAAPRPRSRRAALRRSGAHVRLAGRAQDYLVRGPVGPPPCPHQGHGRAAGRRPGGCARPRSRSALKVR